MNEGTDISTGSEVLVWALFYELEKHRFMVQDEKALQLAIYKVISEACEPQNVQREYVLDKKNTIDFLVYDSIGVEVKIKGQKREIYKQCVRYCSFERISHLLLLTSVSMGFPQTINGKDCYVLNLSRAWL